MPSSAAGARDPERALFPDFRLSRAGTWSLAAGVVLLAAGVLLASWTVALWGQVLLGWLVVARMLGEPEAQALRSGAARARVVLAGSGSASVGRTATVRVEVEGLGGPSWVRLLASPVLGLPDAPLPVLAPGGVEAEARPVRSGHWFVYGARLTRRPWPGLFEAEAWFPCEHQLRVLPSSGDGGASASGLTRRDDEHLASRRTRRGGIGSEFREIRDHRPGDPYRAIAWKASARRNRLLVREFDAEVSLTLELLVDISPSMRAGPVGGSPLDHAVATAFRLAEGVLTRGDRVGLLTFDQRVVHRVRPAAGRVQLQHVMRRLLEVFNVVEADLTAADASRVADHVADYLRYQRGLEVRHPPGGPIDPEWLRSCLRHELFVRRDAVLRLGRAPGSLAERKDEDRMRLLCRVAGIELPYRPREQPGDLADGLVAAVRRAVGAARRPMVLLLLSDLQGAPTPALDGALRTLRHRKQQLLAVAPRPAAFVPRQAGPAGAIQQLLDWDSDPRERPIARVLKAGGVAVVTAGPSEHLGPVLQRLSRLAAA